MLLAWLGPVAAQEPPAAPPGTEGDAAMQAAAKARKPEGALAWFKQGAELAQQGDYPAALARFEKARALSPNWALPHVEIAVAHLMTDNDRAAIGAALKRAVELGPDIPRARYLYGVFLHEAGDRPAAVHELVQALKLRPSLLDARYRLATLYVEEGRQAEGIQQFELVLTQRPSHLGSMRNLAVLYERSGQLEEAEKHLLGITRLHGKNANHLTALARFYQRAGWQAKAQAALREAERLDPSKDARKLRPLLKSRS
ncbi:MAG TPA: tetratricopeptide repeat protein [Myxococcota bacterium]|nr:tetratricopeptide repeat protein [Myxococcota bacterium]HRY92018.1 tetratricopeptide repeat protein [Myxococcota bacterium]HSA21846.1 tetratricopeptide repeat protein [Myxococcota bacterium]